MRHIVRGQVPGERDVTGRRRYGFSGEVKQGLVTGRVGNLFDPSRNDRVPITSIFTGGGGMVSLRDGNATNGKIVSTADRAGS